MVLPHLWASGSRWYRHGGKGCCGRSNCCGRAVGAWWHARTRQRSSLQCLALRSQLLRYQVLLLLLLCLLLCALLLLLLLLHQVLQVGLLLLLLLLRWLWWRTYTAHGLTKAYRTSLPLLLLLLLLCERLLHQSNQVQLLLLLRCRHATRHQWPHASSSGGCGRTLLGLLLTQEHGQWVAGWQTPRGRARHAWWAHASLLLLLLGQDGCARRGEAREGGHTWGTWGWARATWCSRCC